MTAPQVNLFGDLDPLDAASDVPADNLPLVRLAFEDGGDNLYDYAVPHALADQIKLGQRVKCRFGRGNKETIGFCVAFPEKAEVPRVKQIDDILDDTPLLTEDMLTLAKWIASYYCAPLGATLAAMVPAAVKKQIGLVRRHYVQLAQGLSSPADIAETVHLSRKGHNVLDFLLNQDNPDYPIPVEHIMEAVQIGKSPLKTLERAGLVTLTEKQEMPLPETFTPPPNAPPPTAVFLNDDQKHVLREVVTIMMQDGFHAMLLHGVTGSGKTEVYIRAIEEVVTRGGQALVLVPEIALTPQTMHRFLDRFQRVAVLHSALTQRQRHQQWRWIAQGQVQVVVGARSAVFAPLDRLKLIIVDEEHEPSYKQDSTPRYHGRDVAVKRAHLLQANIILGSATPSLESFYNCTARHHYHLLELPRRVMDLPMPKVHIINMVEERRQRKGTHLFSQTLEHEIHQCIRNGKQAMILLNRRGHSNYIFCPSCEYVVNCPNCSVGLTCHKRRGNETTARSWVMCHYCLHSSRVPELCPLCGKKLMLLGPGTQHAEEELARKMPDYRAVRVDSDSVKPTQYEEILQRFGNGEIDILLGTQMIGKGLDFPNVSLVGVLNADTALSLPDFRASERTFQLIAQVAGRCGRAFDHGRVIVQSFVPDDPAIALACEHDYQTFAAHELRIRQRCTMPPYHRLARVIMRDTDLDKLQKAAQQFHAVIVAAAAKLNEPVEIRQAVPAVIATIENYHRMEILLKCPAPTPIQNVLAHLRKAKAFPTAVHTVVDVDPFHLL